ncbi:hypothetical protein TNCV_1714381 [Trichonephila clavipes]|nr:hypothetical protein TNCV_1714381 [Trichonephila clavipes]
MRLQERKGTVDGYEWRCRSQSKDNPHDVVRSVRKGTWFSESKLAITIILRLTRYWFGKSMNAFVVNDLKVNKNRSQQLQKSKEKDETRKPPVDTRNRDNLSPASHYIPVTALGGVYGAAGVNITAATFLRPDYFRRRQRGRLQNRWRELAERVEMHARRIRDSNPKSRIQGLVVNRSVSPF